MSDTIRAARAAYNDSAAGEATLRAALGTLLELVEAPPIVLTVTRSGLRAGRRGQ